MLRTQASPAQTALSDDAAVRSTDSDALVSRHCAHSLGYLDDPAATHFLSPSLRRAREQRPPLINIGTHARTWAIDTLVDQFLDQNENGAQPCQVLSLGAGTDSRFWRLKKKRRQHANASPPWQCANWVEVDFPEQTAPKARAIATKPDLKTWLGSSNVRIERGGLGLSSEHYTLVPGDLRHLEQLSESLLGGTSTRPPLDPTLPTLLLLECVLVYLEPEITASLLSWFCDTFRQARGSAIVGYDPFRLQDQFGTVMKRNLALRSLTLPGADSTPTLASLTDRFVAAGVKGPCGALSIKQIRDDVIPVEELERVAKIEQIDEVEELNLVLEHYAVSWANVTPPPPEENESSSQIGLRSRGTDS
ncbi:hypothetical protein JCM8115_004724 [Rhodotorula mucilaginosa]|uniref:Leucine carboxyl methyltransferase 1 n=1 Tax=Rhodotorula mucilaginosa TaxID=5537 RepID=A0A9P6VXN9_RHOMI|nr:carboxy methyl transferase for protein phosphatase 2A [Rhodotorula mucilaginosa]TKA55703.1 hypothetical protein B0A53_02839 [Rhodotorula sp. CCFEE 5036]